MAAAVALAAVSALALLATRVAAAPDALGAWAAGELQRRGAEGRLVDRGNVSRYFAVYPLPTDAAEGQRLLGTADRVMTGFLRRLLADAADAARSRVAGAIDASDVEAVVARLLPREPTPFDTVVFFPGAPEAARIEVEEIDLEAFADTPFPWGALIGAGRRGIAPELPLADAALPGIGRAVADHGLLVFHLAGRIARASYARELASPHLRQAEELLEELAEGRAPALPEFPAQGTSGGGEPIFVDVTAAAGIDFRHTTAPWLARHRRYGGFAPTFSGSGVAAGDVDADGWPDLVACGGRGCVLYRNRGDGTFEDRTEASGIRVPGEARMPVLADLDADGDADLFVTYAKEPSRLFANRGDGTFADVTGTSGLAREGDIGGPAIAFDADGDSRLDLYVANFGDYLAGETPWAAIDNENAQPNRLFRNLGDLRFVDVTERAGVGDTGWAQAVSHADLDRDGDQDVYVANDFGRNELYANRGDGTFEAVGAARGADDEFHGMNVAFADLDGDDLPEIFVTNIWGLLLGEERPGEYNKLLAGRRDPDGVIRWADDDRLVPELDERDTGWAWAGLFFDADLDGDEDLMMLNGHSDYSTFLQFRPHPTREGEIYPIDNSREANLYFRNADGVLRIVDPPHGAELGDLNSRALALLDFDRDGDLDLAITTFHGPLKLFRNDAPVAGTHWLSLRLEGDPARGVSRDAIGAEVVARAGDGFRAWRTVTGGEGYLGVSTLEVEIGLGGRSAVDLEVRWPNGEVQSAAGVPADRFLRWRQGDPTPVEVEVEPGSGGGSGGG